MAAILFLAGVFLTTAAGAVSVPLVDSYGPAELTWLRFVSILLVLPFVLWLRPATWRRPTLRQAGAMAMLGIASLLGLMLFLVALKGIDLATATGLFFCYPFLSVALAVLFLNERASPAVWVLTLLGLAGVGALFAPQAGGLSMFSLAALGSGAAVAAKMLLTRWLGLGLPPLTTAAGEAMVAVVLLMPFLSLPVLMSGQGLGLLLVYFLCSNASRLLIVVALMRADVSALAALGYSEILFAAGFQWAVFGVPIAPAEAPAFLLIVLAGLGVAARQRSAGPRTAEA